MLNNVHPNQNVIDQLVFLNNFVNVANSELSLGRKIMKTVKPFELLGVEISKQCDCQNKSTTSHFVLSQHAIS